MRCWRRVDAATAATLLALALLAWPGHAAPTQDTLVVRSDNVTTAAPDHASSTTIAAAVGSTAEPPAPIKTTSMEVETHVSLRYARAAVLTRVRNPAAVPQETTFSLLLPDTAFISGFVMTLDGKDYKAYVKEKAEAKQEYDAAVAHGQAAAHVSAKARDSNHFTVRVHVSPRSEAVFNLTYEELLERRGGLYHLAINLHPGGVLPLLRVRVVVREGTRLTSLRVPALRSGNEVDATENDAQNPSAVVERSADERGAIVTFEPDLDEQRRLLQLYEERARESRTRTPSAVGALGQFVVQYDVDHSASSEIFVNDGYFVHFLSPPQLPPLAKHVVFVLDTSGSMMDRKLRQLREAMASILAELRPADYFNIVEFSSGTHVHRLEDALTEQLSHKMQPHYFGYGEQKRDTGVALVPPAPASEHNVQLAQRIVSRFYASGGTNINEALVTALRLVARGVGWTESNSTGPAPPAVPSAASVASAVNTTSVSDNETSSAGSKDAQSEAEAQRPAPIVIFLTDGDPTVGELDPKRITRRVSELNTGPHRAAIFSLAFGEDADRGFLRKLSLRNEGFMRHIYEAADAAAQLRSFYSQVSSPLLAHVKFVYPPDQVEEGSVTRQRFHAVYAGGETVVAGRLAGGDGADLTPTVLGFCGVRDSDGHEYRVTPKVTRGDTAWGGLERLWAYVTIRQKLDERDTADNASEPEREALRLALKYSFVTPLTSLVVVKPNATSAVDAESVDKPGGPAAFSSGVPLTSNVAFGQPGLSKYHDYRRISSAHPTRLSVVLCGHIKRTRPHSLPTTTPSTGRSGAPGDLPLYGLQEMPWAVMLLDTSTHSLTLLPFASAASSARTLKLARVGDTQAEAATSVAGAECARAAGGEGAGRCVYLPRCAAARALTVIEYLQLSCDLRGYAGVCCAVDGVNGTTPADAPAATPAATPSPLIRV